MLFRSMSGRRGCDKSTSSLSGLGVYNRANETIRPQGVTSETPKPDRSTRHSLSDRVLADTFHLIRQPVALLFLSALSKSLLLVAIPIRHRPSAISRETWSVTESALKIGEISGSFQRGAGAMVRAALKARSWEFLSLPNCAVEILVHARRYGLVVLISNVFAYHLRVQEAVTANAAMPLVAGEDVRTPLGAFRVVFGIGHFNNQPSASAST